MKTATIKAKWASKLMRSQSFVLVTDRETVIFSPDTNANKFNDLLTASNKLSALRKFQMSLNRATRQFEADMNSKFGLTKPKSKARKIKVTVK